MAPTRPTFPRLDATIALVRSMTLWQRRLCLWRAVPERSPRFLYKFRRVTPERPQSVQQLRDLLVDSLLWLSSPTRFNDPFDMTASIVAEGTLEQRRRRFERMAKRHEQGNWKHRRKKVTEWMALAPRELRQKVDALHSDGVAGAGVCSFAGDSHQILLWSHYAENHTGVCLIFSPARAPYPLLEAASVAYTSAYPVYNWLLDDGTQLVASMLTKYECWRYEAESRIVRLDSADTYLPFPSEGLVGLILGCKIALGAEALVRNLLIEREARGHPPVRIYRAARHPSRYRVVIQSA
jgi:hypothetical protein